MRNGRAIPAGRKTVRQIIIQQKRHMAFLLIVILLSCSLGITAAVADDGYWMLINTECEEIQSSDTVNTLVLEEERSSSPMRHEVRDALYYTDGGNKPKRLVQTARARCWSSMAPEIIHIGDRIDFEISLELLDYSFDYKELTTTLNYSCMIKTKGWAADVSGQRADAILGVSVDRWGKSYALPYTQSKRVTVAIENKSNKQGFSIIFEGCGSSTMWTYDWVEGGNTAKATPVPASETKKPGGITRSDYQALVKDPDAFIKVCTGQVVRKDVKYTTDTKKLAGTWKGVIWYPEVERNDHRAELMVAELSADGETLKGRFDYTNIVNDRDDWIDATGSSPANYTGKLTTGKDRMTAVIADEYRIEISLGQIYIADKTVYMTGSVYNPYHKGGDHKGYVCLVRIR